MFVLTDEMVNVRAGVCRVLFSILAGGSATVALISEVAPISTLQVTLDVQRSLLLSQTYRESYSIA